MADLNKGNKKRQSIKGAIVAVAAPAAGAAAEKAAPGTGQLAALASGAIISGLLTFFGELVNEADESTVGGSFVKHTFGWLN